MSGTVGIIMLFNEKLFSASIMIFLGSIFDFFDGTVARILKVRNPIGKDLDSLADIITFSLLPALILFRFIDNDILRYIPLVLVVFGALRLARFNNDQEQKFVFKGLPTPAVGILIGAAVLAYEYQSIMWIKSDLLLSILSLILGVLMISPLRMMSLKFENILDFSANKIKFIFVIGSIILILLFKFFGIVLCILLYFLLSVIFK